jgi:hypothetical protein
MFDIVKDSYNEYSDDLKKIPIKDLSAIYVKPKKNSAEFFFFEKYNDFWTYENTEGKFDYKFNDDATLESLINQLKEKTEFDEKFTLRIYDYINENTADYIKLILPGRRRLMNQELFGNYELNRLREVNEELLKDATPDERDSFEKQMDVVNTDVSQIVRLISAQAHTPETLRLTMTMVSQILANVPITPIDDKEEYSKDWATFDQVMENADNIKKYIKLEDHTIEEMYLNIRCTRIIKVVYKNTKTNETEIYYYDTNGTVFIDPTTNEAYWGEHSIETVDLPWQFAPVKEVMLTDKDNKDDYIKFSEVLK